MDAGESVETAVHEANDLARRRNIVERWKVETGGEVILRPTESTSR